MFSMHIPQRLGQITRSFANTDGVAWIVGLVAIAVLGLIAAYIFNTWA